MSATSATPAREPKAKSLPKSALSLRVDETVMIGAAEGDPRATAIRDARKFNQLNAEQKLEVRGAQVKLLDAVANVHALQNQLHEAGDKAKAAQAEFQSLLNDLAKRLDIDSNSCTFDLSALEFVAKK